MCNSIVFFQLPLFHKAMATFVLNPSYGGFELSKKALNELGWSHYERFLVLETEARSNPELVRVCKKLGAKASADDKPFEFVDVAAADIPYVRLGDYDGWESLTIDEQARKLDKQSELLTAVRAVVATHLSDAEKISIITTLLK